MPAEPNVPGVPAAPAVVTSSRRVDSEAKRTGGSGKCFFTGPLFVDERPQDPLPPLSRRAVVDILFLPLLSVLCTNGTRTTTVAAVADVGAAVVAVAAADDGDSDDSPR